MSTSLQDTIRNAYFTLTAGKSAPAWVALVDLRKAVGTEATHADISAALREMDGRGSVVLIPEANQKTLTAADRAAAVVIGGEDQHLMAIE